MKRPPKRRSFDAKEKPRGVKRGRHAGTCPRAHMKSSLDIAKELGVTAQEIERKLNPEFARQFSEHMKEIDGEMYFDGEAEEFLRLVFSKGETAAQEESAAAWEELVPVNSVPPETAPGWAERTEPAVLRLEPAAARGEPVMLPAAQFTWRTIEFPLLYQPEVLEQAVEQQREEITAYLNQFDRMVDRLVDTFPGKRWERRGRAARRS